MQSGAQHTSIGVFIRCLIVGESGQQRQGKAERRGVAGDNKRGGNSLRAAYRPSYCAFALKRNECHRKILHGPAGYERGPLYLAGCRMRFHRQKTCGVVGVHRLLRRQPSFARSLSGTRIFSGQQPLQRARPKRNALQQNEEEQQRMKQILQHAQRVLSEPSKIVNSSVQLISPDSDHTPPHGGRSPTAPVFPPSAQARYPCSQSSLRRSRPTR